MKALELAQKLEHTLLKPSACIAEYEQLVQEAIEWNFKGVCVPPYWVKKAKRDLGSAQVQVISVIGFPLGYTLLQSKLEEAKLCIEHGADELDMVLNLTAFRESPQEWVKPEIACLANFCHEREVALKVILETAYLSEEEIAKASLLCIEAGADYVKTSTGFASRGASIADIEIMRKSIGNKGLIKASGGIKSYSQVLAMLEAGADVIGCSASVQIMREWEKSRP